MNKVFAAGALMLAIVPVISGCTRAEDRLVFVNDCDTSVVVSLQAHRSRDFILEPGSAYFWSALDKIEVAVTLEGPAARRVQVDTTEWQERLKGEDAGVIQFDGKVCDGEGSVSLFLLDEDEAFDLYWHRDPDSRE